MTRLLLLTVIATGCSDPIVDSGPVPDDFSSASFLEFTITGLTIATGNRLTTTITIANSADTSASFEIAGFCSLVTSAFDGVARSGLPEWSSRNSGVACPDTVASYAVPARGTKELSETWTGILGDSLPAARYFFMTEFQLGQAGGTGTAQADIAIRTGNAIVKR